MVIYEPWPKNRKKSRKWSITREKKESFYSIVKTGVFGVTWRIARENRRNHFNQSSNIFWHISRRNWDIKYSFKSYRPRVLQIIFKISKIDREKSLARFSIFWFSWHILAPCDPKWPFLAFYFYFFVIIGQFPFEWATNINSLEFVGGTYFA